ncbi:MAG: hypothetical protein ACKPBA_14320, partial [Planctomycetota bacterium]
MKEVFHRMRIEAGMRGGGCTHQRHGVGVGRVRAGRAGFCERLQVDEPPRGQRHASKTQHDRQMTREAHLAKARHEIRAGGERTERWLACNGRRIEAERGEPFAGRDEGSGVVEKCLRLRQQSCIGALPRLPVEVGAVGGKRGEGARAHDLSTLAAAVGLQDEGLEAPRAAGLGEFTLQAEPQGFELADRRQPLGATAGREQRLETLQIAVAEPGPRVRTPEVFAQRRALPPELCEHRAERPEALLQLCFARGEFALRGIEALLERRRPAHRLLQFRARTGKALELAL